MMLRKQTVWLLTMLAVMVVLSGYYLVKGPNEPFPALSEQQNAQNESQLEHGIEVSSTEANPPELEAALQQIPSVDVNTEQPSATAPTQEAVSTSDFFQGYKMKREAMLQQQKDEQFAIMTSDTASPQAMADAKKKHEELSTLENNTMALEELLKASDYKDAVVLTQNGKVNVIVQAEKLSSKQVVDIIAQVKQQLNVSGNDVTVQFKP